MTERLDRIEATIEANAVQIQANTVAIAQLRSAQEAERAEIAELRSEWQAERAAITELRSTVSSLVQIVEIHQRNHEVSQRNFEAIQRHIETMTAEIRGLRTESQRILEHLFGRQEE
ncbi:hypothetical protein [Floridanema evergladense]|uniref:Uncharacterized protein n=1 Tax=Floridaenema evergladense BLCC-F167 TaxID=3153639 RepID=A0ABV4WKF6_9CYAN